MHHVFRRCNNDQREESIPTVQGLDTTKTEQKVSDDEEKCENTAEEGAATPVLEKMRQGNELYHPPIDKQLGPPVIKVSGLKKSYRLPGRQDQVTALRSININDSCEFYSIRKGEFVMIRGASGGGKTTLLNCIGLIDSPSEGKLSLLGTEIDLSQAGDAYLTNIRLRKLGFVFQTFNLLATFSAVENVELPMSIAGKLTQKEIRARAVKLLTMVGLEDRLDHIPSGTYSLFPTTFASAH